MPPLVFARTAGDVHPVGGWVCLALAAVTVAALLGLWVYTFIRILRDRRLSRQARLIWVLVVLVFPLAAIFYGVLVADHAKRR